MAYVIVTLKIMPKEVETNLEDIEKKAKVEIESFGGEIGKVEIEEVAFGIRALKILFVMDESKGSTEPLEEKIKTIEGIDGHTLKELGRVVTFVKEQADLNSFLDSLVKGKAFVIGKDADIKSKIISNSLILNKHLKYFRYWVDKGRDFVNKKIYNL